jgi:hypothetical protein
VAQQLSSGRPTHVSKLAAAVLLAVSILEFSTCQLLLAAGPLAGLLQMVREGAAAAASAEQQGAGLSAASLLANVAALQTSAARAALVQAGAATALLQPLLGPAAAAGTAAGLLQEAALGAICNMCQGEPAPLPRCCRALDCSELSM